MTIKVSLFLSSPVINWHAWFRFTLHFQLLASICYFQWQLSTYQQIPQWQVSRYQQIPEAVIFFLEERGKGSIEGSYILLSWIYRTEVSSDAGLSMLLG